MCVTRQPPLLLSSLTHPHTHAHRRLTERQRELILEFARTEQLENGTVNGLERGLVYIHVQYLHTCIHNVQCHTRTCTMSHMYTAPCCMSYSTVVMFPVYNASFLGREGEGGGEGEGEKSVVVQENKGLFQKLKEVFWKEDEGEGEERKRQEGS